MKDWELYISEIEKIAQEQGVGSLHPVFVTHLYARYHKQPVIIGERPLFYLREMQMADLEWFYQFAQEESNKKEIPFIRDTKKQAREDLQAYITQMYDIYDYGLWTIVSKEQGEPIGICGIGQVEYQGITYADIGYYVRKSWRKRKIATQALDITLDYAEKYLGWAAIYAAVNPNNIISEKMLKKAGFNKEKDICQNGEDVLLYKRILRKVADHE